MYILQLSVAQQVHQVILSRQEQLRKLDKSNKYIDY